MSDATDAADLPEDDEPALRSTTARSGSWPLVLGLVLAGVAALGGVGYLSGTGWFGYRSWMYEGGELYALNMSDAPLYVSVDGRARVEVIKKNARLLDLVGGTSTVRVTDQAGKEVGVYAVTVDDSHAFLKLTSDGCLAAVHLTPYYGGKPERMEFLRKFGNKPDVWVPNSRNIVWPRKPFPRTLKPTYGKGVWVELTACELLRDDQEHLLAGYLEQRLIRGIKRALHPEPKGRAVGVTVTPSK